MVNLEYFFNPLGFLILFILMCTLDILLAPDYEYKYLRIRVLLSANWIFFFTGCLFFFFDVYSDNLFFWRWSGFFTTFSFSTSVFYPLLYDLVVDGVSLWYLLLTSFLLPLTILVSWQSVRVRRKFYYFLLFAVTFCLFNVFLVQDLWLFYIFFEIILIPMFILIGVWGSRERRVLAAYKFFFFTFVGSIFLLLVIVFLFNALGTTNFFVMRDFFLFSSFFTSEVQFFFTLALMISFGVKLPLFPFHLWLPEAHVEASTAGSVLLAGILLKMGGYGIYKFILPFVTLNAITSLIPFFYLLCLVGIFYTGLVTLRQIDLKKIIAYSSVGHMAYVVLGLFSFTVSGVEGALFLMLSHGIVSSALFIVIGILYDRYRTRIILYYGGLVDFMPIFTFFSFILVFANMGFPGTSAFVGELLVLLSVVSVSPITAILASFGLIFGAVYSIWFFNRLFFGVPSNFYYYYADLNKRELFILSYLVALVIFFGLFPSTILMYFHFPVLYILI